jgi:hypothetical protein
MKEERMVICDMSFETKTKSVIQQKLRQGKKKYLLIGVILVFNALVG